ncbi:MAG: alpha/beta hydrolase [Thermoplasmatota archaeon]
MRRALFALIGVLLLLVAADIGLDAYMSSVAADRMGNHDFERDHVVTPADYGMAFEALRLDSDGLALAAWWIPGNQTAPVVVLVHGHGATMAKSLERWGPNLHGAGYNLFAVDLRNHGASDDGPVGVTFGASEWRDVAAAVAAARERAPGAPVALYGSSMGAATVLLAAAQDPTIAAVVADSGYASFRFQAHLDGKQEGFPAFLIDRALDAMDERAGGGADAPTSVDAVAAIQAIRAPVLVAHCADDARVQPASFERLAPYATQTWFEPCPTAVLSETHHVEGFAQPGYNEMVLRFLAAAMP